MTDGERARRPGQGRIDRHIRRVVGGAWIAAEFLRDGPFVRENQIAEALALVVRFPARPGDLDLAVGALRVVDARVQTNRVADGEIQRCHASVFDGRFADIPVSRLDRRDLQIVDGALTGTVHVAPVPGLLIGIEAVLIVFLMAGNGIRCGKEHLDAVSIPNVTAGLVHGQQVIFDNHRHVDMGVIPQEVEFSTTVFRTAPCSGVYLPWRIKNRWSHRGQVPVAQVSVDRIRRAAETMHHQFFSGVRVYGWRSGHRHTGTDEDQ